MSDYDNQWIKAKAACDDFKGGTVGKAGVRTTPVVPQPQGPPRPEEVIAAERRITTPDKSSPGKHGAPPVTPSFREAIVARMASEHPSALVGKPFQGRMHTEEGVAWAVGGQAIVRDRVLAPDTTQALIAREMLRLERAAETLATIGRMPPHLVTRSIAAECVKAAVDDPDGRRLRRRERNDALARTDVGA